MVLKILWMLLTFVSFLGLCGLAKERLQLDDSGAPLIASCIVIIVLMLAGMANVLLWGWWALQVAGLAGCAWVFIAKRKPFSLRIIGLMAAAVLFNSIAYRGTYYIGNDAVSHWAMAAKYLVCTNRFPDAGTGLIHFPSYPLGAASFIYFFCHTAGESADYYIMSQALLSWFCLMPLLGFVRKNRAAGFASALLIMACLMGPHYFHYSMVMELLLAQMALGGTFIIVQNHCQPRKAIIAALPVISTLMLLKSSGIFFSVLLCMLLTLTVRRASGNGDKLWVRALLSSLAVIALSFILWQIHVKLAYGNAFAGKHAISLANYSNTVAQKTPAIIREIAIKMFTRVPKRFSYLCITAIISFSLAMLAGKDRKEWLSRWKIAVILSAATFILWYFMLFLTYIFSMPIDEALILDAIDRYEYCGINYSLGIMAAYILVYICSRDWKLFTSMRWVYVAATALATVLVVSYTVYGIPSSRGWTPNPDRKGDYPDMLEMKEKYSIEEGKSYIYFGIYGGIYKHYAQYKGTRYEFFSNDLLGIYYGEKLIEEGGETEYGYRLALEYGDSEKGFIQDIRAFLAEHIDEYDYLLVYDYVPEFDAVLKEFLKDYHGDTQVCYSY